MSMFAIGINPSSEAGKRFDINNSAWATLQGYMVRFTGQNISLDFVEVSDEQGWFEAEVSAEDARAIADRLDLVRETGEFRRSLQADVKEAKVEQASQRVSGHCDYIVPQDDGPDVDAWEEGLRIWAAFLRDCGGCSVSR